MNIKHINITIPKIDYQLITLSLKENGQMTQLGENDLLYFTISKKPDTTNYILQKSIDNGITYDSSSGKYLLEINSNDTKDLILNNKYGYDITIYYDGNKPKQKVIGTFEISDKFTMNEVVSNG